jgi:hypothetical protein
MDKPPFAISLQTLNGYDVLLPDERAALNEAIAPLQQLPYERWPEAGAVRLESPEPLFFLKVDKSWRAIVRPTKDGKPELL